MQNRRKKISAEAQNELDKMNFNQIYYIAKNFNRQMDELVVAGYVEKTESTLGDRFGYKRIN